MVGYVDVFEETGLLREFVVVLDRIDSALATVERCRPPSVIEWFYDVGVSKVKIGYPKYIAQENGNFDNDRVWT